MAIGALLLAAIPPFTTFMGKSLLEEGSSSLGYNWLIAVYIIVSALTGGAVLRVVGRVFLGWGPDHAPDAGQEKAAAEEQFETRGSHERTPVLMLLVPAVLLLGVLVLGLIPGAVPGVERLAALFVDHHTYTSWVLHGRHVPLPLLPPSHLSADDYGYGALSVGGALGAAGLGLFGRPLRDRIPDRLGRPVAIVRHLHSGHIGDYIAWWTAGVSAVGGLCLVALR